MHRKTNINFAKNSNVNGDDRPTTYQLYAEYVNKFHPSKSRRQKSSSFDLRLGNCQNGKISSTLSETQNNNNNNNNKYKKRRQSFSSNGLNNVRNITNFKTREFSLSSGRQCDNNNDDYKNHDNTNRACTLTSANDTNKNYRDNTYRACRPLTQADDTNSYEQLDDDESSGLVKDLTRNDSRFNRFNNQFILQQFNGLTSDLLTAIDDTHIDAPFNENLFWRIMNRTNYDSDAALGIIQNRNRHKNADTVFVWLVSALTNCLSNHRQSITEDGISQVVDILTNRIRAIDPEFNFDS